MNSTAEPTSVTPRNACRRGARGHTPLKRRLPMSTTPRGTLHVFFWHSAHGEFTLRWVEAEDSWYVKYANGNNGLVYAADLGTSCAYVRGPQAAEAATCPLFSAAWNNSA